MTRKGTAKQRPARAEAAAGAVGLKRRGKRARGTARFGLANSAYRVPEEYLTDLAQDIDDLSKLLHGSETSDVNRVRAMISRLGTDTRYTAIKPALAGYRLMCERGGGMRLGNSG